MSSTRVEVLARSSSLRCVLCHGRATRSAAGCSSCGAVLHRGCARTLTACPTLGCAGDLAATTAAPREQERPTSRALAAWLVAAGLAFAAGIALGGGVAARRAPPRRARTLRAALSALRSDDPQVRADTTTLLGSLLRADAVPEAAARRITLALLERAARDDAAGVRTRALAALGDGAPAAVVDELAGATRVGRAALRLAAVEALGDRSLVDLLRRLDPALEPDARVRALAATRALALARADAAAAREVRAALAPRLDDEPAPLVRALLRLGALERGAARGGAWIAPAVGVVLDEGSTGRAAAGCRDLLAAVAGDAQVMRALGRELVRGRAPARALAATILGGVDVDEARELLRVALSDDDPSVQAAAQAVLAARGSRVRRPIVFTCSGCFFPVRSAEPARVLAASPAPAALSSQLDRALRRQP